MPDEGVVIMTGAASGIGRAAAKALAAKSRALALVDINARALAEVVAECRAVLGGATSGRAAPFACDISDGCGGASKHTNKSARNAARLRSW